MIVKEVEAILEIYRNLEIFQKVKGDDITEFKMNL
jgi:hypothetical protein